MECPNCGYSKSKVIDSWARDKNVLRIRECLDCHHRFQTRERRAIHEPSESRWKKGD